MTTTAVNRMETKVDTQPKTEKPFPVESIRKDFPLLSRTMHGKPLVYLDNAASTQKPNQVIERMKAYYHYENANIHRGVYELSQPGQIRPDGLQSRCFRLKGARVRQLRPLRRSGGIPG